MFTKKLKTVSYNCLKLLNKPIKLLNSLLQ